MYIYIKNHVENEAGRVNPDLLLVFLKSFK